MIKPITIQTTADGVLEIGGVSLEGLARNYGTPLYVIDQATLAQNCAAYTQTLDEHYPDYTVAYACKAGICKGLVREMSRLGMGLDVVSGGEIMTAIEGGADLDKVYFHGNNKSLEELKLAISRGIRIVIDHEGEAAQIMALATEMSAVAKVLVRLKPEIEAHTHEYIKTGQIDSKFGVMKDHAFPLIKQLNAHPQIEFLGIHGHIGSQIFDITPYKDLAEIMTGHLEYIKQECGIEVKELNLGGGIGIQYTAHDDPPEISDVLIKMTLVLKRACQDKGLLLPKLIVEPGRSIIATAGVTLYTVGYIKDIPGVKSYVFIDGGMADNPRFIMYKSEYTFELANKAGQPADQSYSISGKFCESGDMLGHDIKLPKVDVGDILVVYGTGAYNYAMASNYNRFCKPQMVIVENGNSTVLIARETIDDVLGNDQ